MSIVVTRNEWGAASPYNPPTRIGRVYGSGLHWEGPEMGWFEHDICASMVRGIQRFHMKSRGWNDIAYNAVVCYHGYIFQGRWIGVRSAANGTNDSNAHYYAICGLFGQEDVWTEEMLLAYWDCINIFRQAGAGTQVKTHREFKPTMCAGPDVQAWKDGGLLLPGPPPPPDPPPAPPTPPSADWLQETINAMETLDFRPVWNGATITGAHVDNLQGLLLATMRDDCNPGAVDGKGGPKTMGAVAAFQRIASLPIDLIVGPQTWRALITW